MWLGGGSGCKMDCVTGRSVRKTILKPDQNQDGGKMLWFSKEIQIQNPLGKILEDGLVQHNWGDLLYFPVR